MRKIIFFASTGSCGSDGNDAQAYDDDVTDEQINSDAHAFALENAEMYGIYPREDYENNEDYSDEELDGDEYSSNIEGWWEDYDPEKHDGLVPGGGEWQWR